MSEPLQFDNSVSPKSFEFKAPEGNNDNSPLQKRFRDPKEFEVQFFKNKQASSVTTDEKESKESTSKI
jgi:hypothetical protein